MFNFIDDETQEDEHEETLDDDEGFLDLSDLYEETEEEAEDREPNCKGVGNTKGTRTSTGKNSKVREAPSQRVQVGGLTFGFEDEVPEARSIADPEVRSKARRKRKSTPAKMDYSGKRELGWSLYCSHKDHLPNLCEREQNRGEVTCTCTCHEARGYVRQPESVSGSDDEEILLLTG